MHRVSTYRYRATPHMNIVPAPYLHRTYLPISLLFECFLDHLLGENIIYQDEFGVPRSISGSPPNALMFSWIHSKATH